VSAAEHFDWAVGRAMEYVEMGDARGAMSSLVTDLGKHQDTRTMLRPLMPLFVAEIQLDGARGARRFIEGLPRPGITQAVTR
jgi:hypothetical protein